MQRNITIRNLKNHILLLTVFILSTACRTNTETGNKDFFTAKLNNEVNYFPGSLISGPMSVDINSFSAAEAIDILVKIVALKQIPSSSLDPMELHTRMIIIEPADKTVEPVSQLTRGSRIGSIPDTNKFISDFIDNQIENRTQLQQIQGVLLQGVTTSINLLKKSQIDSEPPEGFELRIYREIQEKEKSAGSVLLNLALVANGKTRQSVINNFENTETEDNKKTEPVQSEQEVQITETVILENLLFNVQEPLGIIIPSPFNESKVKAFAITIDVKSTPKEDAAEAAMHTEAFKKCIENLKENNIRTKTPVHGLGNTEWSGLTEAIKSLQFLTNRREALLYLAQQTKSAFVEDIALSGTDIVLESISDTIIKNYSSNLPKDNQSFGWMLDRSVYTGFVKLMSSEKSSPELESVLVRHTGEIGRHASSLEELISSAVSREDFESRLIKENFIYLEDMSPASRTRAFEWLAKNGQVPKGYNPLAPLKERRAALNQFEKSLDSR